MAEQHGKTLVPQIRFAGFTDPWEQRKLGEVASGFEYGLNAAASDFDGEKKYLRITDIDDQTREFRTDDLSSPDINNPIDDRYLLKEGDILFARTGASVGKTYLYKASDGKTYYAGFLIRAHVSDEADAGFIFQSTLTERYKQFVLLTSQRSGQPGINAQEYSDLLLPLPSLMEQRRIGAFFDRLDSLITLHQRKYDKLCVLKKSMLDKMFPKGGSLYPEIRFAGFTDPWEQRKLGELGFAQSGIGFPDAEQGGSEGIPFFKVSDMNTPGNERELVISNNYVTADQIARMSWHPICQVPAIFFAKVGAAVLLNRKRLVNEPFLLDNNTMAFSMDPNRLDSQFGQSLFERIDLTSLVQVGALPSYNASDVEDMAVSLPDHMDEQRRIGAFFDHLDSLITLHQRKYDGCANPLFLERRISCRKPSHQNRCSATTTPSG